MDPDDYYSYLLEHDVYHSRTHIEEQLDDDSCDEVELGYFKIDKEQYYYDNVNMFIVICYQKTKDRYIIRDADDMCGAPLTVSDISNKPVGSFSDWYIVCIKEWQFPCDLNFATLLEEFRDNNGTLPVIDDWLLSRNPGFK